MWNTNYTRRKAFFGRFVLSFHYYPTVNRYSKKIQDYIYFCSICRIFPILKAHFKEYASWLTPTYLRLAYYYISFQHTLCFHPFDGRLAELVGRWMAGTLNGFRRVGSLWSSLLYCLAAPPYAGYRAQHLLFSRKEGICPKIIKSSQI